MNRRTWRGLAIAAAVLLGAALLVVALALTIDLEPIARAQLARVQAATGRELTIDGPLRLRLLPRPAVTAERVAFANAKWGSRPQMATIRRVDAVLALWPLLQRRVEIVRLELVEPDILLETGQNGTGNWEFAQGPKATAPGANGNAGPAIDVAALRIHDGRFTWRKAKEATTLHVRRATLDSDAEKAELRADLQLQQLPVNVQATMGSIADLLARRAGWPLDLRVTADGGDAHFVGTVDRSREPLKAAGQLDVTIADAALVARLAGRPVALPLPANLSANATLSGPQIRLEPLKAQVGKSQSEGSIVVDTGRERPRVRARIATSELDFAAASAPAGAGEPSKSGPVFDDQPLPFATLQAIDGELAWSATSVRLANGLQLSGFKLQASLNDGRLSVPTAEAQLAGGTAALRADVRALERNRGRVSLALSARGVALGDLLAHGGNRWLTGGPTDMQADLAMEGATQRQLASSANGTVRLAIGPGRIEAKQAQWLALLLQALRPGSPDTLQVECAAAVLPFKAGVASVERGIALEAAQFNAVASGSIDLRNEAIDLAVQPSAAPGVNERLLRAVQVVRVHGPWRSPKVGVDAGRLVEEALTRALQRGSLFGDRLLAPPDAHPCRTVLQGRAAAPTATQPGTPAQPQPIDVEQALRKLFRR